MPQLADSLPRASFSGFEYPITKQSVKGSGRKHVHEYPHSGGGQIEKLGRKLYVIEQHALFLDTFKTYAEPTGLMRSLVGLFERQLTFPLVVPMVGTIMAVCDDWPREQDFVKIRNGETAKFTFTEDPGDQSAAFLVYNAQQSIATSMASANSLAGGLSLSPFTLSLLQQLTGLVAQFSGVVSGLALYGSYLGNQVSGILGIFESLDSSADMQNSANWPVLDAIYDVVSGVQAYAQSMSLKSGVPMKYSVPHQMSIAQVSTAIFGNTSQAITLLQMNAIDDAFAIPPGFDVTYLSTTGQAAA